MEEHHNLTEAGYRELEKKIIKKFLEENRDKLLGKDNGLDHTKLNIGKIQDSNENESPGEVQSIRYHLKQRLAK